MDNGINEYDELDEPVVSSPQGRKRKRDSSHYAKNVEKRLRHSGMSIEPTIACNHKVQSTCLAASLTEDDLNFLHRSMYSESDKVMQDALLLTYMDIKPVTRRRSTADNPNSRDMTIKYHVTNEDKEKIPVCKATFMSIFGKYVIFIYYL